MIKVEQINKVEYTGNYYIINDDSSNNIPHEPKNRHFELIQRWLKISGNKMTDTTFTQTKANLIKQLKAEAATRILSLYPDFKQRNILMSQDSAEISTMNDAISVIRAKSNEIETSLNSMTKTQVEKFDPTNDLNWE